MGTRSKLRLLILWISLGILLLTALTAFGLGYGPSQRSQNLDLDQITVYQEKVLNLTFAGDLMAHNVNYEMTDFSQIYQRLETILQADDLSFVNLEFPVDDQKPWASYPSFNVHPPYVEAAIQAGFEVFSLANNHSNDQGPQSIQKTQTAMNDLQKNYPIWFHGVRAEKETPWKPVLIEKGGFRIGFFSATNLLNSLWAKDFVSYVPWIDYWDGGVSKSEKERLREQIELWKKDYDLFILSFHDGVEYATFPTPEQREFYRDLVEAGVDILWAHHPHVLQPWERVEMADRSAIILYSMGNFISGQTWRVQPSDKNQGRARTGDGALFQIQLYQWGPQLQFRNPRPILLNNHKIPLVGMVSATTEHWMTQAIDDDWKSYFAHRYEVQSSFLTPLESLGRPVPAGEP